MSIRTVPLGGTDWSDGSVLYAADLNDTFDAAVNYVKPNQHIMLDVLNYKTLVTSGWTVEGQTNNSLGYLRNVSTNGTRVSYPLYLEEGTYQICTKIQKYSQAGILEILVDDTSLNTLDMYSSSGVFVIAKFNIAVPSTGLVDFDLKISGKNGASSNYGAQIYTFSLQKIA